MGMKSEGLGGWRGERSVGEGRGGAKAGAVPRLATAKESGRPDPLLSVLGTPARSCSRMDPSPSCGRKAGIAEFLRADARRFAQSAPLGSSRKV